jgi:YVTN family beta-propeller protein
VYVTNFNSDSVSVIDTTTNTVIATVAVGLGPKELAVGSDAVYVPSFATGTVSVIDTDTNTVRTTYTLDYGLQGSRTTMSGKCSSCPTAGTAPWRLSTPSPTRSSMPSLSAADQTR